MSVSKMTGVDLLLSTVQWGLWSTVILRRRGVMLLFAGEELFAGEDLMILILI